MKYFIFSILLLILFTAPVMAYDCPFGFVNDPYPGQCSLYVDKNNDGFCDYGQNILSAAGTNINKTNYYIWQIIAVFIIFQLIGISLIQYNKLNKMRWRKINNYILLISFIIVFITSFIMLINLSGIRFANLRTINRLHIESGLVMMLFCAEHVLRRWKYYFRVTSRRSQ